MKNTLNLIVFVFTMSLGSLTHADSGKSVCQNSYKFKNGPLTIGWTEKYNVDEANTLESCINAAKSLIGKSSPAEKFEIRSAKFYFLTEDGLEIEGRITKP